MNTFSKGDEEKGKQISSFMEGDEQLDQPKSQTRMGCCHAFVAYFLVVCHRHFG